MQVTEVIGAALVSAVLAAVGFVARQFLDWFGARRTARNARLASLAQLWSVLRAGRVSFEIQRAQADRLLALIRQNHTGLLPIEGGYERVFSTVYPKFTPEERELHSLIRGLTIHSLRPVNQQLAHWLNNDFHYKAQMGQSGAHGELAEKLSDLEAHLLLWHAKYATWIPDHPEHALVYMADEQAHGLGFPAGLEDAVERALQVNPAARG